MKIKLNKIFSALFIVSVILMLQSCAKDIIIPDAKYDAPAIKMFGEIPERKFFVQREIKDSLLLKWSTQINGGINTSALAVQGDFIFCSDLSGRIYAFKLSNGKEQGYLSYKNLICTSPIVNQLKLVFAVIDTKGNKTKIYHYDFRTGRVINEIEIEGKVIKEMIRLEDGFIVATENGKIYRYHYNSTKKWEYTNNNFIHSSAAANKDYLVFGDDKGFITILNITSGEKIHQIKISAGIESGFAIFNNYAFFGDKDGNLYSVDLMQGKIIWNIFAGSRIVTFPMIDDKNIFIGNLKGELLKLNLNDGSLVWKIETQGVINTTGLVFNNIIVQPNYNKKLFMIDKGNGKILNTIEFEDKLRLAPFFYNDMLFLGTETGQLFAYEVYN